MTDRFAETGSRVETSLNALENRIRDGVGGITQQVDAAGEKLSETLSTSSGEKTTLERSDSTLSTATTAASQTSTVDGDDLEDDFDKARKKRYGSDDAGGWKAELQRYLQDPCLDVTKDADTVQWLASCAVYRQAN